MHGNTDLPWAVSITLQDKKQGNPADNVSILIRKWTFLMKRYTIGVVSWCCADLDTETTAQKRHQSRFPILYARIDITIIYPGSWLRTWCLTTTAMEYLQTQISERDFYFVMLRPINNLVWQKHKYTKKMTWRHCASLERERSSYIF